MKKKAIDRKEAIDRKKPMWWIVIGIGGHALVVADAGLRSDSLELLGFVAETEVIADALEALAKDGEMRERMGVASRRLAEEAFSRDALASQFCEWVERFGCGKAKVS